MKQCFVLGAVLLVLVADGLDVQLLALTAPLILKDWGIERSAFGAALSAALLGMSLGSGFGGWLGDRVGRKPVLVGATLCFAVATAFASLTTGVAQMALLRVLSGIGFGAAVPNGVALASEWLPERHRARSASLLSVGVPLGGLIGAAGLILLLPVLGWKGSFVACGLLTFGFGVLMLLALPESPTYLLGKGRIVPAAGVLRSVLGVDVVLADARPPRQSAQPGHAEVFGAGNRRFNTGVWLAYFSLTFVAYALAAWSPVLLTEAHFTLSRALSVSMAFNLMAVFAAVAAGLLIARVGSRRLSIVACVATLCFILVLGVCLAGPAGALWVYPLVLLSFAGIGAAGGTAIAAIYAIVAAGYPEQCRAAGIGAAMLVGRIGAIASTFSGGALIGLRGASPAGFIWALALFAALAWIGETLIDRHVPAQPNRAPANKHQ